MRPLTRVTKSSAGEADKPSTPAVRFKAAPECAGRQDHRRASWLTKGEPTFTAGYAVLVPTQDGVLHALEQGEGATPVVLLHGLGGSAESWQELLPLFAATRRALCPDLRGCGRSGRGSLPYRFEQLADDVVALLDHADVERCHLVGHSFGGVVAQDILTRHQERVCSAVLVATSSKVGEQAQAAWQKLAASIETDGLDRAAGAQSRGFARDFVTSHADVVAFHANLTLASNPGVYAEQARAASSYDYTEALSTVDRPVLIVQGLADRLTGPGGSVIMSRALPSAELWMVEGAGHNAHIELGQVFHERVEQFFGQAEQQCSD